MHQRLNLQYLKHEKAVVRLQNIYIYFWGLKGHLLFQPGWNFVKYCL